MITTYDLSRFGAAFIAFVPTVRYARMLAQTAIAPDKKLRLRRYDRVIRAVGALIFAVLAAGILSMGLGWDPTGTGWDRFGAV